MRVRVRACVCVCVHKCACVCISACVHMCVRKCARVCVHGEVGRCLCGQQSHTITPTERTYPGFFKRGKFGTAQMAGRGIARVYAPVLLVVFAIFLQVLLCLVVRLLVVDAVEQHQVIGDDAAGDGTGV